MNTDTPSAGSPAHAWRMRWVSEWSLTCPKGKDWTALTKNLKAFMLALGTWADADGTNTKAPGQAKLATNIGCAEETIAVLYRAAEALGAITCRRTPMGRVKGYALLPHLPGWVPDWASARVVLESDRRAAHKRKHGTPSRAKTPSRDGEQDGGEIPSRDGERGEGPEGETPSRDIPKPRHVTNETPSRDGATRIDHGLNHDMAEVVPTGAPPRGRAHEEDDSPSQEGETADADAQPTIPGAQVYVDGMSEAYERQAPVYATVDGQPPPERTGEDVTTGAARRRAAEERQAAADGTDARPLCLGWGGRPCPRSRRARPNSDMCVWCRGEHDTAKAADAAHGAPAAVLPPHPHA